jgi:serine phosphatase RsbU (regulator of sigma subunit)
VHAESGRRFDEVDLTFAEQLAGNAAFALDNAWLYEQQRAIAETLQAALLPAALPEVPGVAMAARYRAQSDEGSGIQVGGDLYDVVATPEPGCWAFVMADVCGKGPHAAALTALIRHTLRAEIGHDLAPAEALHRLNRAMLNAAAAAPARFATVVHGRLAVDAGGATVTLASGGHPSALVRRKTVTGVRVEPVDAPGTLLGVYTDIELTEQTVRLDRGDMLVLYTDGVTEARGVDGFYGADRLSRRLASSTAGSADALADELLGDVVAFQDGRLRDDVALLVLEAVSS